MVKFLNGSIKPDRKQHAKHFNGTCLSRHWVSYSVPWTKDTFRLHFFQTCGDYYPAAISGLKWNVVLTEIYTQSALNIKAALGNNIWNKQFSSWPTDSNYFPTKREMFFDLDSMLIRHLSDFLKTEEFSDLKVATNFAPKCTILYTLSHGLEESRE